MLGDIQAIVFDFGGVLIDIDYERTKSAFSDLGISDSFSQLKQDPIFDQFETGKISSQYFINQLLKKVSVHSTPNQVVKAWNSMLLDISIENINLLESLKSKYRLYMLSNTNDIHIKVAFDRWEQSAGNKPSELFDEIYLSHEIGLRKPDLEVFKFIHEELTLKPEQILFIDDSPQHIESAKSIGFKTIHLKKIDGLSSYFS